MEKLINDLSPAIQKLSEIFCVSVEYIQEHFMEYVLMYGRYDFWSKIGLLFLLAACAALAGGLFGTLCILMIYDYPSTLDKCHKKIIICCAVISTIVVVISWIAPYMASPEIYSIKAVLKLIN